MFAPPRTPKVRCNCPIEGCRWSTIQPGRVEPHLRKKHPDKVNTKITRRQRQASARNLRAEARKERQQNQQRGLENEASIETLQAQLQRVHAKQEEIQANQVRQEERLVKLQDSIAASNIRYNRKSMKDRALLEKVVKEVFLPRLGWEYED